MLAPFDWLKHNLGRIVGIAFVASALFFVHQVSSVQAAAYCGFRCEVTHATQSRCVMEDAEPAPMRCSTICRENCSMLGMTYDPSQGSSYCTAIGDGTERRCSPCKCTPNSASFSCVRATTADNDPGENNECPSRCAETCTTARYRDRIATNRIGEVRCANTPAPRCVVVATSGSSRLTLCRACISRCIDQGAVYGTLPVPADCYQGCQTVGNDGALCEGVPQEQAIEGMSSAPTGAVGSSGDRRGRIQSGTSAATNEAAALAPGTCAQRAVASDPANGSLISMSEATFGAASTTWTCRRVCSTQEQAGCVQGGCPGDASIRCCPSSLGIAPAQQCGGRGTNGGAAAGATGGTTPGGAEGAPDAGTSDSGSAGSASNGGSSGASDTGGDSPRSSVVGSSNVTADSGGLTRLILPSCIEDGGCQFSDLVQAGLNLVRFLFGLAGVLLLVVFVYAGIEYLIAGDVSGVKSAEDRIKKALVGLFFMFFGYTLVNFLVTLFVHA